MGMNIEQVLMRSMKVSGGLTQGRNVFDSVVKRWTCTIPGSLKVTKTLDISNGVTVKNQSQASDSLRTLNSRASESNEQRERRIHCNALGNQNRVQAETFDTRLQLEKWRQGTLRASNWFYLKDEAPHYDPNSDYPNFPQIAIGSMSSKCTICGALKFEAEASRLYCSNGKVSLTELPQLPEPLKSLMEGNHPKSKEFLSMIRKTIAVFR
ncbi:hypothetical protein AVEN_221925-1 [Araneus ventricosus]|uniref:Uncharacterized protein n=1 Tax=Araneus ventricosus TaxID=182803 RepID=A0A4Y2F8G4_ARAVE|nr:hypothetical protein AVEN_221925-1 [Araneus ventricosus]